MSVQKIRIKREAAHAGKCVPATALGNGLPVAAGSASKVDACLTAARQRQWPPRARAKELGQLAADGGWQEGWLASWRGNQERIHCASSTTPLSRRWRRQLVAAVSSAAVCARWRSSVCASPRLHKELALPSLAGGPLRWYAMHARDSSARGNCRST